LLLKFYTESSARELTARMFHRFTPQRCLLKN
jgi:hypothetical protein